MRHFGSNEVESHSAGTIKTGVNPKAIQVMQEIGIDISSQSSKTIETLEPISFDYAISLCTEMEQGCPITPGVKKIHWPTLDPGKVEDTPEEIQNAFREVRDELKERVIQFLDGMKRK